MKKIPKKNYIILLVIIIFTVLLALFLRNLYITRENRTNNFQLDNLYQIDEKSLYNYIIENGDFILYVAQRENENLNEFEKDLGKYLTKKEYNKNIIYLNLDNVSDSFYAKFKKKYFSKSLSKYNFEKQTNLLYFENKKVVDILYSKKQSIKIADFEEFIEKHNNLENEL